MTDQLLPPANWYADPDGSGRWRYWDGASWTAVYLNQDEPGSSAWRQYWDKVSPLVLATGVVWLAVATARGNAASLAVAVWVLAMPESRTRRKRWGWAYLGALGVGITIHSGWRFGLALGACGVALALVDARRGRLPRWLVWTLLAFAGVGIGVLYFASQDFLRG